MELSVSEVRLPDITEPSRGESNHLSTFLANKKKLELSESNTDLAEISSATLAIGSTLVAGIAATGVGLPVAGVLGIALFLTSIIIKKVLEMSRLKLAMLQVLGILAKCYLLETMMTNSRKEVERILNPDQIIPPDSDDAEIVTEVSGIISTIFSFVEDGILKILTTCGNPDIETLAKQEIKNRNSYNLGYLRKAYRGVSRFTAADWYQKRMIEKLSVLNSLFMLKYSRYNFSMKYYKSIADHTKHTTVWNDIYKQDYFKGFVSDKIDIVKVTVMPAENSEQLVAAVNAAGKTLSNEIVPNNGLSTGGLSTGGTMRKKRKLRMKKRTNKKR